MRYIIATDGTWGDVLPFMFIAKELISRGHDVLVISNEYYLKYAETNGIPFRSSTTISDRARLLDDRKLWDPKLGMSVIAKYTLIMLEKTYPILEEEVKKSKIDMIISHSFTYSAKAIALKHNIKHACVLISPIQSRSTYRLPVFYGGKDYNYAPHFLKKLIYPIVDKFILDSQFPKEINEFMKHEGLGAIKSFVYWTTKTDLTIGLWESWYSKSEKDQKISLAGFPKNVEIDSKVTDMLESWIENLEKSGKKPILVTLGSGYLFSEEIIKTLKLVSQKTSEKFIFVGPSASSGETSETSILEINISERHTDVFIIDQVSFSKILQKCEIIIHHGGAGTISQSIYAGIPQIIIPQSHDQPDNAYHIKRAGLGEIIWDTNPGYIKIVDAINSIRKMRLNTTKNLSDGIQNACDLIVRNIQPR